MILAALHAAAGLLGWATGQHALLYPTPLQDSAPAAIDMSGLAWFLFVSVPVFLLGWILHWAIGRTGELPPAGMFAVAAALMLAGWATWFPVSGFPLAAALCLWLSTGPRRVGHKRSRQLK